jgi:hypothetical protein
VRRAFEPRVAVCYKAPLQSRLPVIRIPLREQDTDVRLDLQDLVDQAWQDGGYYSLSHARGPLPSLSDEDAEWVRERMKAYRQ